MAWTSATLLMDWTSSYLVHAAVIHFLQDLLSEFSVALVALAASLSLNSLRICGAFVCRVKALLAHRSYGGGYLTCKLEACSLWIVFGNKHCTNK